MVSAMTAKNRADIFAEHTPGFGFLLSRTSSLFRARLMTAISDHGLQVDQALVLMTLQKSVADPPLTQTRLCKVTGIEKSSLVLLLDELEKRGWVERKSHPSDRRAYVIVLTPIGTKRCNAVSKVIQTFEQDALSFLSKSQRAVFGTFLTELIERVQ